MKAKGLPHPSLPLANERHEKLAGGLSLGLTLTDAYLCSFAAGEKLPTKDSAKVSAFRIQKSPVFQARLKFLRERELQRNNALAAELSPALETFTKQDILDIYQEVSVILNAAFELSKFSKDLSSLRKEQLRAEWTRFLQRWSRYAENTQNEVPEDIGMAETINANNAKILREVCTCKVQ